MIQQIQDTQVQRKLNQFSSQLCKVEERSSVVCEGGSLTGVILKAPSTPLWWINTCYLFTKFQLHILKNLRWVYLYKNIQRNLINPMLLPCYCQFLYIVFSLHVYSEYIWFMKPQYLPQKMINFTKNILVNKNLLI